MPLVDDRDRQWPSGWTTYAPEIDESPEGEIFGTGVNTKTPTAAGLWRQGHLLHFGFEQAPGELNVRGEALLVNAIHYIARFTEDRPIARTPSVFVNQHSTPARCRLRVNLAKSDLETEAVDRWFAAAEAAVLNAAKDPEERVKRFDAQAGFYAPDATGRLGSDADLVALGVANKTPAFFDRCLAALAGGDAPRALRALARFVPEGPGANAAAEAWSSWITGNRTYLFFYDSGGYRWYVDPLARQRSVPSAQLRGPARASPPPGAAQKK